MFNSASGGKPHQTNGALTWEPTRRQPLSQKNAKEGVASYTKIFRWQRPEGQTQEPKTVEIVGSFTKWGKVPLSRDAAANTWQATLEHIPAHQTHHYMLLVDGKPAQDKNCDGLAIAHGPQEEHYAISTPRGPRVFMLFAQTK